MSCEESTLLLRVRDSDCSQIRQCVSRCHQPDLVTYVRHGQHIRGLPPPASAISQSYGSPEWRSSCLVDEGLERLRRQSQRSAKLPLNLGEANISIEYVTKYASKESVDDAGNDSNDSDEMSSVGSFDDDEDDEPAGTMEEV